MLVEVEGLQPLTVPQPPCGAVDCGLSFVIYIRRTEFIEDLYLCKEGL